MSEARSTRFTKYFPMLLDALRSADPTPMRPAEVIAWIRGRMEIAEDDLTRQVESGSQSIFENDVHWARFYLAKAGLIGKVKRGVWGLTPEGREARLTPEETRSLYVRIRDAARPGAPNDEENLPAPKAEEGDDGAGQSYWFLGSVWDNDDQLPRFLQEGIWTNGYEDQFNDRVMSIKPGDRIAVKATFVQKHRLPFEVGGKPVSAMRIKATGIVLENLGDGQTVKVAWDPPSTPRDWYFYTYRTTIVEADIETEGARRLVDFAFRGQQQDYARWLAQPYWVAKYGANAAIAVVDPAPPVEAAPEDDVGEPEEDPPLHHRRHHRRRVLPPSRSVGRHAGALENQKESDPPGPTRNWQDLAG